MKALEHRRTLEELKQMLSLVDGSQVLPLQSFSLFQQGFPPGRVIEVTGIGKTEFIAQFLKESCAGRVAWVEDELTINPFGLWQRGLRLPQITFVETKELSWAIQQILHSQVFQVIVLSQLQMTERDLRRFQLLIEKSSGFLFLLSKKVHKSWVPALQIEVLKENNSDFQVDIYRQRGCL